MDKKETVSANALGSGTIRDFSLKILIVIFFALGLYLLSLLTPVLTILFFSGFLTILFAPFLERMKKRHIPDFLGIIIIFFLIFLFFFVAAFAIIPIFIKQIVLLFSTVTQEFTTLETLYKSGGIEALPFPAFLKAYLRTVDFGAFFEFLRGQTTSLSSIVVSGTGNLLSESKSFISTLSGGIFQGVMIVVFTFFMSLERRTVKGFLYEIFPDNITTYLRSRENDFLRVLSLWIRGQLLLSLTIFALTLLGLFVLRLFGIRLDGIFTLALIAGMMEFIPYIGPLIALLPALAIAATLGIVPIIAVTILYITIQQTENNIIVPVVMSRALDISPFLILLTITIMASLFGIVGILLAIPLTALLQMVVRDLMGKKRDNTQIITKKNQITTDKK